ncbi:hypothetical protein L3X38_035121 [Prunus dulcis]|uniref:Uncharacterized protein n=1 Tax=Prunus dulcis TaxID=3755 RepID=A0AAD4YXI1_PRUDU|nr:hypothetical protein L3X38_035121 [Prunus dulcis]
MLGQSKAAYKWLEERAAAHWSRSHFTTVPKCDILINNLCECFNAAILEARDKPIVTLLERIKTYLKLRMARLRETVGPHEVGSRIFVIVEKNTIESGQCIASYAGRGRPTYDRAYEGYISPMPSQAYWRKIGHGQSRGARARGSTRGRRAVRGRCARGRGATASGEGVDTATANVSRTTTASGTGGVRSRGAVKDRDVMSEQQQTQARPKFNGVMLARGEKKSSCPPSYKEDQSICWFTTSPRFKFPTCESFMFISSFTTYPKFTSSSRFKFTSSSSLKLTTSNNSNFSKKA